MKSIVPVSFVGGAVAFAFLGASGMAWAALACGLALGVIQAPK